MTFHNLQTLKKQLCYNSFASKLGRNLLLSFFHSTCCYDFSHHRCATKPCGPLMMRESSGEHSSFCSSWGREMFKYGPKVIPDTKNPFWVRRDAKWAINNSRKILWGGIKWHFTVTVKKNTLKCPKVPKNTNHLQFLLSWTLSSEATSFSRLKV